MTPPGMETLAVAVTFDQHPANVVAPDHAPALLQTGHDSAPLSPPESTLRWSSGSTPLSAKNRARHLSANSSTASGPSTAFAWGPTLRLATGEMATSRRCRRLAKRLAFTCGLQAVALDGQAVSSTRIRDAVREGRLDDAGQMLGRNFAIEGTVIKGDGKGRQIGFATANIDTSGRVLPPNGVYAVHAQLGQASHRAVLNIGVRPTLAKPEPSLQVEAHLLDYDGELYGKQLRVEFVDRLRDEKRFDSVKELTTQISRDIERAFKPCFNFKNKDTPPPMNAGITAINEEVERRAPSFSRLGRWARS